MYQYKAPETELIDLRNSYIELAKEVFQANVSTHFELIELTTPAEWKKIQ
jgi:hypothetical protein